MSIQHQQQTADHRELYLLCVDHIGQLERRLESLQEIDRRGPCAEKLDVLKELLADVGEFLRAHSDAQRFESSVACITEIGEELKELRKLMSGRSWSWLGFDSSSDADKFEIRQRYDRLKDQYMPFVVGHLIECINALQVENNTKHSFLESVDAFSGELLRVW